MPLRRLYHDDAFDPLADVGSYWQASAPPPRHAFTPLSGSLNCEVAVIGAGYTGLNCALRLARDFGSDVRVFDAGEPGFGASGRNGGFCCIPATKVPLPKLAKRFGLGETRRFFRAQLDAVEAVAANLERHGVDADVHSKGGELCLAHRPSEMAALKAEAAFAKEALGVEQPVYPKEALRQLGAEGPKFHGAMASPYGFALHPLKYLRALADAAVDAGVPVHGRTEVTGLELDDGGHVLTTAAGEVRARSVVVATNGYSAETMPGWLGGRLLPALSSVLVTRPLTTSELQAQGFTTDLMSFDTRTLLHYFRLMPDRRFLFGGRGGTDASLAGQARWRRKLRADFERMFPAWARVEATHGWSGFVALAARGLPYVGRIADLQTAWTALAFHGNGVATGSWSGQRLAGMIAGAEREDDLPAPFRGPLRRFPLPALRPACLSAAYAWYGWRDAQP